MHVSEIKPFPADTDVGQESVATVHLYPLDNLRWDRGKESWYEEKYKIHLYDTLDYCTPNSNSSGSDRRERTVRSVLKGQSDLFYHNC